MDLFKILPVEIKIEILSRLPSESVLVCKLVCTDWRNHVRHPLFSKTHLYRLHDLSDSGELLGFIAMTSDDKFHYFEYNDDETTTSPIQRIKRVNLTSPIRDFSFVGSCNGLIYFCSRNPITREYVMLPDIKWDCRYYYRYWSIGFGYVSSTNEYKVVVMYAYEAKFVEVYIYTLGSGDGWRKLGNFKFKSPTEWSRGIFADGALYWLDRETNMIIIFDLAEEKFGENLSPPPLPEDGYVCYYRIGVSNASVSFDIDLFVEGAILKKKNDDLDKKEGEEHQSLGWSKEFRVYEGDKFLDITKSDGVLTYGGHYLYIHDSRTSTSKRLVEFKKSLLQISPHWNTLVSLKDLGEEDTKTMRSIGIQERGSRDYSFPQL